MDNLKSQIEAEEREIAILKAQLAIKEKATKEESLNKQGGNYSDDFLGGDLLDILDALGVRSGEAASRQLSKEWLSQHSNHELNGSINSRDLLRLQPLVSGIEFRSIKSIDDNHIKGEETQKRTYELVGSVYLPQYSTSDDDDLHRTNMESIDPIIFEVVADISILYEKNGDKRKRRSSSETNVRGQIEKLYVTFPNRSDNLSELKYLMSTTVDNNLPRLFRNLVRYAEFEQRRYAALQKMNRKYGNDLIHVISPSCVKLVHPIFVIVLEWKWQFSPYFPGNESLALMEIQNCCNKSGDELDDLIHQIKHHGIEDLIESVGGCELAITALLDIISSSPTRKQRVPYSSDSIDDHPFKDKSMTSKNESELSVLDIIKRNNMSS